MAIINIRNAEVTRTFWGGKGAGLKEAFRKNDGTEGARYYSAFFDEEHGLSEGDRGNFSGLLGTKVSSYPDKETGETKYGVDVTLNSARFEAGDGGSAADDEAPF